MFGAVAMVRVRIQVPVSEGPAATHAIARLGLLHLIDVAHGRAGDVPASGPELLAAHRAVRERVGRTLDRLGVAPPPLIGSTDATPVQNFDVERQRLDAELTPAETAVTRAWTARADALGSAAKIDAQLARAEALGRDGVDPARLAALRFTAARVVSAAEDSLASLSAFLSPTPHLVTPVAPSKPSRLAIVMTPASARARLDAALRLVHVETFDPPSLVADGGVDDLRRAAAVARRAAADAEEALAALRDAHAGSLRSIWTRAETCVLLLQAQEQFGLARRFLVISGWVPARDVARLRGALAAAAPRAVIDVETPESLAEAPAAIARIPILHRNPVLLRPFQPLIDLYDTPSYGELQPTAFFAISFLVMFGLMFGDVGHGLVLCAAGYYVFRYLPRFLDYGILLMEAGAASAAFGLLYGSFLGIAGALPVLWLEPVRDLPSFMRIAVGFGVALVSAGLVLNVINSWRLGERAAALVSVRGLFGAFLYWTALVLIVRALLPRAIVVPAWLLVALAAGAGVLIVFRRPLIRRLGAGRERRPEPSRPPAWLRALEGSVELVDSLFGYFANTISFIRIAAFAAVHAAVFIAMFAVADTLAGARFGTPLSSPRSSSATSC